jgi:hypothetical protein
MDILGYAHGLTRFPPKWLAENPTPAETLEIIKTKYQYIQNWDDGLLPVSKIPMFTHHSDTPNLAFHHDDYDYAGVWGFINQKGEEVIPCQYIFTYGFRNGRVTVCKGKWEEKDWDYQQFDGEKHIPSVQHGIWTSQQLWGQIDTKGNVTIPLIFEELRWDDEDYNFLAAKYNGLWGVINKQGEWLVAPMFEDVDYFPLNNDLFLFYSQDMWDDPDYVPCGVYSIKQHRVVIEAEYTDIELADDNVNFVAELADKETNTIKKWLIDRNNNKLQELD